MYIVIRQSNRCRFSQNINLKLYENAFETRSNSFKYIDSATAHMLNISTCNKCHDKNKK